MRIAIVHDYLVNRGGAERVVLAMHRIWPEAPIYTSVYHADATYPGFAEADVRTSFLQERSTDPARFRRFLPLFPRAFARMDLSDFDVVVSSSSGFAHHVRPRADAVHIVYAYSPPRFLWDPSYGLRGIVPALARPAVAPVRAWLRRLDLRAAARPQVYLAVSRPAADRIARIYGREAEVIHPPVDLERFALTQTAAEDHWLVVGRLLPYRCVDIAVQAFTRAGQRLIVVGDGPARAALEAEAGPTVEFRGVVSDDELARWYAGARGVVVPGVEDFGLIPLEANASGRPAVAFGAGGALETVIDGTTGVLFHRADPARLFEAVERAQAMTFEPAALRRHAETFAEPAFAERLRSVVERAAART